MMNKYTDKSIQLNPSGYQHSYITPGVPYILLLSINSVGGNALLILLLLLLILPLNAAKNIQGVAT